MPDRYLDHERLIAYTLTRECAAQMRRLKWPDSSLKNQALRAIRSTGLNVAEGCQRTGADRSQHMKIARGSAAEACACLDFVDFDAAELQAKLRRIVALIHGLS